MYNLTGKLNGRNFRYRVRGFRDARKMANGAALLGATRVKVTNKRKRVF